MEEKLLFIVREICENVRSEWETPVSRWENENRNAVYDGSVTELALRPPTLARRCCMFSRDAWVYSKEKSNP